jgi:hypothetical protein
MAADNSLEVLRAQVAAIPSDVDARELWVPESLTSHGKPIRQDIAMAILLDDILARGFMPDGKVDGRGGVTYRYRRE